MQNSNMVNYINTRFHIDLDHREGMKQCSIKCLTLSISVMNINIKMANEKQTIFGHWNFSVNFSE